MHYMYFQLANVLINYVLEGVSNSGERFQNNAVSVAGFTGFMWTKG